LMVCSRAFHSPLDDNWSTFLTADSAAFCLVVPCQFKFQINR
jgi:hypothetical protein